MRLIDADALKEYFSYSARLCEDIDKFPTIEEREAGKWLYTDAYPHWMYCDRCHKRIVPNKEWIELYNIPTNYCPNCGANMKGEE